MRTHTQQFKQNLIKMGRQVNAKVTVGNRVLNQELFSVTPILQSNIMKSVMKEVEIVSSVELQKDTIIKVEIGLKVGNSYEYLNYGNYVVYSCERQEDDRSYFITAYDKMIYSMKQNEEFNVTYPVTIKNYLSALATKIGLTLKNTTFYNQNQLINSELYAGLGYTYRDILDEIAQAVGGFIIINADDELEVIYPTTTNDVIGPDYLKDVNVNFGEKYGPLNSIVLSRTEGEDNVYIQDEDSVLENGLCEIKIKDNQILSQTNRSDYLQGLLDALDGLEFSINDYKSTGILYYEVGDIYTISYSRMEQGSPVLYIHNCLMLNDEIEISQGIQEFIHTEMPEQSVTDYIKADKTDRKLNQTTLMVDKQEQKIQGIVSEIGDRSEKTTTLTEDIDGLEVAVQDIEDLTNTVSANKTVTITDAYPDNDILELHIYGNNTVFDQLYPRDDLFPDDTLYPYGDSKIRFYNSVEDRTIELGITEVLRANSEVKDEVYLDPQGNVSVIRRVNKNGTTKPVPEVTQLGQLHFTLLEGANTFEIVNYNAIVEIKYAMKSTLTDIFATRVEMNSSITQTADAINTEVRKKVNENEVISKINQSAEQIQIEANKVSLARKRDRFNG